MLIYSQDETKSCYKKAKKRPLTRRQDGGNEYTVSQSSLALAKSNNQDVTVVIIFGEHISVSKLMLKGLYVTFRKCLLTMTPVACVELFGVPVVC